MATKRDFVFDRDGSMLPSDSTVAEDRRKEIAATAPKAEPKQTFGQAFAAARRAGKKNFTFNGKSYTTETRDDQKRAAAAKAKKRDDADFAAEEARSKTARAVAGDSDNRQRDAEDRRRLEPIAAQGKRDAMASASRRARAQRRSTPTTQMAAGGKVRGYGMARGGKVTKIC